MKMHSGGKKARVKTPSELELLREHCRKLERWLRDVKAENRGLREAARIRARGASK